MIKYYKNDFIRSAQQLADYLADYQSTYGAQVGVQVPPLSGNLARIYNCGDILDYEFVDETYQEYSGRVSAVAEADLIDGTTQPYIDDPELWLDAILRPRRRALFIKYDHLQGVACWNALASMQREEFQTWRARMCEMTEKYPTFVDPDGIEWPTFSFMDMC